jgi:sigma-54 specific flagellar transcriptional regulator A
MREVEPVFLVVCRNAEHGRNLKELIEFLDLLPVRVAGPTDWLATLGACRPIATFLGPDLDPADVDAVVPGVGEIEANSPIVVVSGDSGKAAEEAQSAFASANILRLRFPVSFDELGRVLDESWSLRRRNRRPGTALEKSDKLIGDSPALQEIRKQIDQVAPTAATVLLNGESGTGKEVVARRIHELSGRTGRFVAVNCGAIPDHLLESELFGHERGAFTGAESSRTGRFEWAEGGTLFLDEIGDMPKSLQVKLLRVLQERVIERIGGTEATPIDIRLVAATHRDLPKWIEAGNFREDLFYRLSVFPIDIPPLRERKGDIEPLVEEFIGRACLTYGANLRISGAAMERLKAYSWPGNVRELANLVERLAVIDADRIIEEGDLPWPIRPIVPSGPEGSSKDASRLPILPEGGINLKDYLSDVERRAIEDALGASNGVVQAAADRLGMGRTTLVEKIKRYEIAN